MSSAPLFNVTKDDIRVRMAAIDEDIWPLPSTIPLVPPDPSLTRTQLSQAMLDGRIVHREELEELYDEINSMYGSNLQLPD